MMAACSHGAGRTLPSRRAFLGGSAAACLCSGPTLRAAKPSDGGFVDVHHHFYPPDYVKAVGPAIAAVSKGFDHLLEWTPQQSLDAMDAAGIAKAHLSLSTPGTWFGDPAETRRLSAFCNDYAAGLVRDHPSRFGFFAGLPLPLVDDSVAEIGRALDRLGADGIGVLTSYDGRYLGDPLFEPVLRELDRRRALLFVHPTAPACCGSIASGLSVASIEFPFDTTRTIASLAFSGAMHRFPDIRFLFSHGGGTVPFLVGRMASAVRSRPDLATLYPDGIAKALAAHRYDTVSITSPGAIAALKAFAPPDRLLFGTDYPYGAPNSQVRALTDFGFSDADYRSVSGGNARRLLT